MGSYAQRPRSPGHSFFLMLPCLTPVTRSLTSTPVPAGIGAILVHVKNVKCRINRIVDGAGREACK